MDVAIVVDVRVAEGDSVTMGVGMGVRLDTLPVAKTAAQQSLVYCGRERRIEGLRD